MALLCPSKKDVSSHTLRPLLQEAELEKDPQVQYQKETLSGPLLLLCLRHPHLGTFVLGAAYPSVHSAPSDQNQGGATIRTQRDSAGILGS